ncbi:protein kinase [Streptomyces monashensis]|uniref:serine/threonine-protein kinase n=1 Tax=Streptomyces monashensis TaxID=1678012 RepID=UPI0033D7B2F8
MPTPLTHDDPLALGPFRLIARLGSGGMGTVYVARSAGGRTVALKTMHAAIATESAARTRFRLEVDAARVIGDRFGARVMDADPLAETPWLATEYVLGPSLDEAVEAGGPLPERSVRALGAALCSALGQLHRSDVVHRDLKPSNILLTAYGPKVIDFGIARAIGDDRLTRAGAAVGTPAFMSPEQATGREHDAAGDVFALAGVLVYASTGRGPFGSGQAADLLYRVRYAEADLSGVPAALVSVLAHCLAKEPASRPTTAQLAAQLHDGKGEFADYLPDELIANIARRAADVWRLVPQRLSAPSVEAGPVTATSPPSQGLSRRGLLAAGGAFAVAAAGSGGLWWYRRPATTPAKKVRQQTRNLDALWNNGGKGGMEYDKWGITVPCHANGSIWLPLNAIFKRIDPLNGSSRDLAMDGNWWQVAVVNDRLYMLDQDYHGNGRAIVVATWDQSQNYRKPTSARLEAADFAVLPNQLLCISDNVAYVAVGDGGRAENEGFLPSQTWFLRAADLKTGKTLWTKPLPKRSKESYWLHFLAAKVAGGRLVTLQEVQDNRPHIVVRDIDSGAVLWDKPYDIEDIESLKSEIAADDKCLYVGGAQLQALRLSDGIQVWATESGQQYSPPTLAKGVLYAVGEGVGLTAVDTGRGKVLWTEATAEADKAYTGWRPIVGIRYAYYKNGPQMRAVSLSSHDIALTYKTTAVQFHADTRSGLVLGMDSDFISAYPLK